MIISPSTSTSNILLKIKLNLYVTPFIYLFIGPTLMVGAVKNRVNNIERQYHKTIKTITAITIKYELS